jgi:transposase-like protein
MPKYQVLNKDKDRLEYGKKIPCPVCNRFNVGKGYGTNFPENKCHLCLGYCFVIKSNESGWVKPLYKRLHESKLY